MSENEDNPANFNKVFFQRSDPAGYQTIVKLITFNGIITIIAL